jgi:hypothetical protein
VESLDVAEHAEVVVVQFRTEPSGRVRVIGKIESQEPTLEKPFNPVGPMEQLEVDPILAGVL